MPDESRRLCAEPAIDTYRKERKVLEAAQQPMGIAWMWADSYSDSREIGTLLLDLFGYLPVDGEVENELHHALSFRDPKLKYYAALSLLRLKTAIKPEVLDEIAASSEVRIELFAKLKKMGALDLFPVKYRNQAALAESDMVRWLTFPTELGRVPDEIELMKVISADTETDDGIIDYFVFRFRTHEPHWSAKDGWMAGVSGPFLRKNEPTENALGETFSRFERWGKKTAEEHVGDTSETIKKWREHHAKRNQK